MVRVLFPVTASGLYIAFLGTSLAQIPVDVNFTTDVVPHEIRVKSL